MKTEGKTFTPSEHKLLAKELFNEDSLIG